MADASTKVEDDLMKLPIDVDLYKVAHHGSNTSSSVSFLKHINYQYAIIMSGYANQFGFPKEEVVARFDERLLVTKTEQTIYFYIKRGKLRYQPRRRIIKMLW